MQNKRSLITETIYKWVSKKMKNDCNLKESTCKR